MHICRKTGIFKLADVRISICNMAGNKINTKTKGKEDKGRVNKGVNLNSDDVEDLDFALLRKPVHTSVTGFAQARKIFDLATEELKDLLSNECDLLYECKVCRNIFRSLANLISHKRVYCKEKFNTSVHGHFIKSVSTLEEIIKIKRTEVGYQEALKNNNADTNIEEVDRIPLSKDLTAIVENIARTKGTDNNEETQVALQKIPSSSVAVFQNVNSLEDSKDNMRAQIKELDNILSREQAVLQSDGQFTVESTKQTDKDTDSVIQISDDEDNDGDSLKCKICDNQFSTQKTLRFHMKYKHLESRLVYPCPDCLEIFSTSWSVYRHLFKVHRKTAAQIRRLRESIQSKAFRMNNPPAFYEKRKNNMKAAVVQKITEEERLDQENQAWMDNMEGDGEVPRCGGCGRTFERRAALAAHTHTCQPRSRALQRRPDAKRIEIQIRKDYNKGPGSAAAGTLLKDASEKLTSEEAQPTPKSQTENEKADDADEKDQSPMDIEEDQKSNDSAESPEKPEVVPQLEVKLAAGLPFALQAEKSNLAAFKQRIQSDIEFLKLTCKKCDSTFTSLSLLYEHMADHFKWMRYACKLCNFKNYNFEKLPEHVKLVHKLKGDNDFYFSTVKAIDGTEAMILSRCLAEDSTDEANDANESPESRRASRCSSDSSRISDDSSSSSTFKETGTRKRKMRQNKYVPKRKKEEESKDAGGEDSKDGEISMDKVLKSIIGDDSTNVKSFEENSSDIDEIEDKVSKRNVTSTSTSVASRRPVRKRTKPKNEDFEYDLSNLLKMEAQGYRDSQSLANNKTTQVKKKQPETVSSPEINSLNLKDYYGALLTLSKKTADTGKGHMKNSFFPVVREIRTTSDLFVRPQIPRILYRGDKVSPKKDMSEDLKDSSPGKHSKPAEITNTKDLKTKAVEETTKTDKDEVATLKKIENVDTKTSDNANISTNNDDSQENSNMFTIEDVKTLANTDENNFLKEKESAKNVIASENSLNTAKNSLNPLKIPAVLPIKFRRQSLDLIKKNPIINKNITDFTKAGMKTKILVIKPIRSKDGSRTVTTPLKYQTIKLKDPNRGSTSEDNSEQVVVVKVPKVDRTMSRTVPEANDKLEQTSPIVNTSNKEITEKTNEENEVTRTAEDVRNDERACDEINNKCNDLNNISVASDMNKEKVSDSVKQLEADVTKPDVTEPSSIDKET